MVDYPITQDVGLGADGKFTGGDPSTGESASRLSAAWMNAVTDELLHVLRAAGLNPDEMDSAQLLAAIRKLVWSPDQIPGLDAEKIVSGALELARLPGLPASKITHEFLSIDRLPRVSTQKGGVPVGSVFWHLGAEPPEGYLELNGAELKRELYLELWDFAQQSGNITDRTNWLQSTGSFHTGDGSETFGIPDLRGEFLRGWDHGRNIDTDRKLGQNQQYEWKSFYMYNTIQGGNCGYSHGPVFMGKSMTSHIGNMFGGNWARPVGAIGIKWDKSEIRPNNIALLPILKY